VRANLNHILAAISAAYSNFKFELEMNQLLDSFAQNERVAESLAQQEKNKRIHEKIFQDDRVPSSL
jgi:hypothetical protein